jgi:hypothetical protein
MIGWLPTQSPSWDFKKKEEFAMIKGLAYTCASILGLKEAKDRKKVLDDYRKLGQEEAELLLTQRLDDLEYIDFGANEGLPADDWMIAQIGGGDGKVLLHPYVYNEESLMLKDASLQPEKSYTTQGDPVWVCKGFALEIDEAELRRYHPHLKAINIIK